VFADLCNTEVKFRRCQHHLNDTGGVVSRSKGQVLHFSDFIKLSSDEEVCPHKAALEAAATAHIVICDYNYLFSDIRTGVLERMGVALEDIVIIVDEAHNLSERIRNNFGRDVSYTLLDEAMAEVGQARRDKFIDKDKARRLNRFLEYLQEVIIELTNDLVEEGDQKVLQRGELLDPLENLIGGLTGELTVASFMDLLREVGEAVLSSGRSSARGFFASVGAQVVVA
jgi:Rad3-related DNA helicase